MRSTYSGTLGAFLAVCLVLPADAQDSLRLDQPAPNSANPAATMTGKERLSTKWMDEQRVDNCNVPIDKRGPNLGRATARMFRQARQAMARGVEPARLVQIACVAVRAKRRC